MSAVKNLCSALLLKKSVKQPFHMSYPWRPLASKEVLSLSWWTRFVLCRLFVHKWMAWLILQGNSGWKLLHFTLAFPPRVPSSAAPGVCSWKSTEPCYRMVTVQFLPLKAHCRWVSVQPVAMSQVRFLETASNQGNSLQINASYMKSTIFTSPSLLISEMLSLVQSVLMSHQLACTAGTVKCSKQHLVSFSFTCFVACSQGNMVGRASGFSTRLLCFGKKQVGSKCLEHIKCHPLGTNWSLPISSSHFFRRSEFLWGNLKKKRLLLTARISA